MDGVFNAVHHARYIRAAFEVLGSAPESVIDFGFGTGHLLAAVGKELAAYRVSGIEPSPVMFGEGSRRVTEAVAPLKRLALEQVDLASWCARPDHAKRRFELGLCTSVLQYLTDEELEAVIPVLAERVKWLYFTVPTTTELRWMREDDDFVDRWAIERTREDWRAWVRPHFEVVGLRLLESRSRVELDRTPFTDHLYRGW